MNVDGEGAQLRVAMILAAGRGERMRPLTDSVPKPLLRVGGTPLIERHIERLVAAGFQLIVINLAWLGWMIRDYLGDGSRFGVSIRYSEETPRALETAGGIHRALTMLQPGPFLVVNGDVLTDYPFGAMRLGRGVDARLILVPNPPQYPQGDFGLEGGLVIPDHTPRLTFSGIAAYDANFFAGCVDGVFPLKPLLLRAMAVQRCAGELYQGMWEDVGTPQRLQALNARPVYNQPHG